MSRRKKQTIERSADTSSGEKVSDKQPDKEDAQLIGREPVNPPRKNRFFLFVSVAPFTLWVGFLIWLAGQRSS